ncbi:retrotransposon protein, putative, ty1-copia subclass [Tanacetum coccineum]
METYSPPSTVSTTFKARLVAKGFTQTYRVDYEETFSPVADIRAIRILLAIAAFYDYKIWKMDVKTTFLNGHLSEDVYMVQPEGFVDPKHPNKEPCVYLKASGSNVAFLVLYVDDILLMEYSVAMLQDVKSWLFKCFSMKDLGGAAYILVIKIIRDKSKLLIALSQTEYIAAAEASMEAVWMRKFIVGLGGAVPLNKRHMEMLCDNAPAIAIANDPGIIKEARHYQRKYHYR